MEMTTDLGAQIRMRLQEVLGNASSIFDQAETTLANASPTGEVGWFLSVIGLAFIYMAAGYGVSRLVRVWLKNHFFYLFNPNPPTRADKISYLWIRGFFLTLEVVIYALVASLLALAFQSAEAGLKTQMVIILAFGLVALVNRFFMNLLSSDLDSHRVLPMTGEEARGLKRDIVVVIAASSFIGGTCVWMDSIGLNYDAHLLMLIGGIFTIAFMLCALAYKRRLTIQHLIFGGQEECSTMPVALRLLARNWHMLAILYFLGAAMVSAFRLLMDLPSAMGLVLNPVMVLFFSIALYGLALVIVDRISARFEKKAVLPVEEADITATEDIAATSIEDKNRPSLKKLFEHAAALVITFGAIWFILGLWGVDVASESSPLVAASDVLLVIFMAYLTFEGVKIAIDRKIEAEGGFETAEPGDEGGGAAAASRLATLLPMFRNFLLITVLIISGMIVLSELGVDIAPLFAGAGVVGLAIGFGAQTLIRDIFSGAFFLIDDAFRKGEYIDVGSVKGTVEKISIRSMQLRHHLGALHTIPFGEIIQLTNYSRDWVMMKLKLRVTYDTDVEQVRKLIKKLGQELLEHEEIGSSFLQPLKSQGVYAMEDSAMIIRVKFMTKPGEQFVARKLVYSKIRELFEKHGIKFAHREVTVRLAGDNQPDMDNLSEEDKEAIAGAALPAIEDPQGAGKPADGR